MDTITFQDVGPGDEAGLFQLFSAVRGEELGMQDWDPAVRRQMLQLQFEAQRRSYREQFPAADERLILRDGSRIGWVIVDRSGADLHGIDIALLSSERSKGVGTRIIRALQEEAAALSRPMVITVQRMNVQALALYRRLDFRVIEETDLHTVLEWRR